MNEINDTIGCVNHDCAKCKSQSAPVQEPLFWYRPVGEDGGYEGPLHNGVIEKVRKESGAWIPLVPATTPPAAQPAVPLTRERVKEILSEEGYDRANVQARVDFITGFRAAEAAHGITAAAPEKGGAA